MKRTKTVEKSHQQHLNGGFIYTFMNHFGCKSCRGQFIVIAMFKPTTAIHTNRNSIMDCTHGSP